MHNHIFKMRFLIFAILSICVICSNNSENRSENFNVFSANLLNQTNVSVVKNAATVSVSNEIMGKICLKNLTKCEEEDVEYRSSTDRFANFLFSSLPPFDLSQIEGVSRECRIQSKQYIESLANFQMWALRMYDSSAKFPSGVLNGNLNQLGDFDMCLSAASTKHNIQGQYCLAALEVQNPRNSYLSALYQLIHSHNHFKSKLEDPGHRVPRFSSINWALCVPSACSPNDVELGLRNTVQNILDGTEIEVRYEVDPTMCQKKENNAYPRSMFIVLFIFGIILGWEIIATFYDCFAVGNKNKWIMAFSIKENFLSSIKLERAPTDIETVHGIRCVNAILLLVAHKSMAAFYQPAPNRTAFIEYIGRPFSVLGRAASLYTDPFLMMSGLLTTYSLLGRLNKTKKLNIIDEYLNRLFRLVPTLGAVIAFCTFIMPFVDSGPMWNLVVTHHSDICKKYWWRNLMFIHNYFGFGNMCLTHTHHLGIDTQLFFSSPFMIYLIWKWPRKGFFTLTGLAVVATFARFFITYKLNLSNYIHFGTSIQQLFDTADRMYILPAYRSTVYIMGVLLGYVLRNYSKLQLTKAQLNIGNTLALFSFCVSLFGAAFMGKIDYEYNPTDGAWYAAVSPILWCFSFAWVILTWQLGYKNIVGTILSNKIFLLWTKVSYTVYLVQFPVYFYNVGTTKSSNEISFLWMILSLREYIWIIGIAIVLTLTFELPFVKVRNIYLKRKDTKNNAQPVNNIKYKTKNL
ncbi:unnamed protein product [Phyllotreta striolata]|uniref:Nose resistant-to-fluoxetine protein N-terminal domain-containing protein n=1 Tax=Phyllotreta striolata TaxID=444603 RepID=A0A9N9TF97_PHYSR|nr:unnamed protein product [Phyllotreta striolata]